MIRWRTMAAVVTVAMPLTVAGAVAWAQGEDQTDQPSVPTETFGTPPEATAAEAAPSPAEANAPATTAPVEPEAAQTQEAEDQEKAAEGLMQELMADRPTGPVIEPSAAPVNVAPLSEAEPLPSVSGVAPDQAQPPLYREGEFVVSRRGRLARAPSGHLVFAFEADAQAAPEPPMALMPCRLLENMEELVRQRGDRIVFVLSGQVFTYHNRNWLLPTMMKVDVDRGNLQK